LGSSSSALSQVVQQAKTKTVIASSLNPSKKGQVVTFTTITSPTLTPTGKVKFTAGTLALGTITLNSHGKASISTATLPKGSTTITASYAGGTNFTPSSASLTQKVN
jgi:hypothetical protein